MRLVNCYGCIYRMSERNFRAFLKAGAADPSVRLDAYGTQIGVLSFTATDADAHEYQDVLDAVVRVRTTDWRALDRCDICLAGPGERCASMQKRYEHSTPRTPNSTDRRWRKTPHPDRPLLSDTNRDEDEDEDEALVLGHPSRSAARAARRCTRGSR